MSNQNLTVKPKFGKDDELTLSLMQTALDFLKEKSEGDMFLDLSEYLIVHSATISTFINITKEFSKTNRSFIIKNVDSNLMKLFEDMNLQKIIKFDTTDMDITTEIKKEVVKNILEVDFETYINVGIYKFSGSVKSTKDSAQFLNVLNSIITEKDKILIDMEKITIIDSLGIGVLIKLLRLIKEGKANIRFFGINELLNDILDMNNLKQFVPMFSSKEEAVRGWK